MTGTEKKVILKIKLNAFTNEELEKVVDELNEQLELDPPIEKGKRKQMRKDIRDAMGDENLFEGREEFTKETYEVFKKLGIGVNAVKIKTDKKGAGKDMTTKIKKKKMAEKITKKKTGAKKQGIGQFVVKNLKNRKFKKLSNQEIVDRVRKEFPSANTTPQNINWYKGKIKKGEL